MTEIRRALVIGGGIAGPAAGIALRKAEIEPLIFEAHPHSAEGTGAFLTLATNGIDALRALDADQEILSAGFSTPWITLRSGTGKYLGRTPTGVALSDGTLSQTIKRSDLYRALHDHARARGVTIEHGKRLVDARREGERVRAIFADGSQEVGDVLIGCDGVRSTARRLIDPGSPAPRYERLLTTGGYARGVDVAAESGSYEMIFGARAFFGYVPAPDGEVWWFANVPRAIEPAHDELRSIGIEERRRLLSELFAGDAGPATALINTTSEIMPLSPIHTMPRVPRWYRERMIVLGDAAHAPSPTSGQGASLSIEDAAVLALALRDADDPQTAFARFETSRRPRAERIIKWAARVNNSKAPTRVGRIVRDATLPTILKLTAGSKAQRQPFEHHVEWSDRQRDTGIPT